MLQIIRRSSFTASPWKNGTGVTHEVVRVPDGNAAFRWRLSVAQVDASGPFSDFAGYRRTLVLLRGAGVRLDIAGAGPVSLTAVGAMVGFDGALAIHCQLLDGPCMDLNLMVDASVRDVATRIEPVTERRPVPSPASRQGIVLIFAITGSLVVEPHEQPAARLEPWDLAILPAECAGMVAPDPAPAASALVFFATLDDNLPLSSPR